MTIKMIRARRAGIYNEQRWCELSREICEVAQALLDEKSSLTEVAARLKDLSFQIKAEEDPAFYPFCLFAYETDRFPFGELRDRWHPETLPALDREREAMESQFIDEAKRLAVELIQEFGER